MKKTLLIVLFVVPLFSYAIQAPGGAGKCPNLPENVVEFQNISNLTSNSGSGSYKLESGQFTVTKTNRLNAKCEGDSLSYNPYIMISSTNQSLDFSSLRDNSDKNVSWVQSELSNQGINWASSNMTTKDGGTSKPDQLNFAFYAFIEFTEKAKIQIGKQIY